MTRQISRSRLWWTQQAFAEIFLFVQQSKILNCLRFGAIANCRGNSGLACIHIFVCNASSFVPIGMDCNAIEAHSGAQSHLTNLD
jgi:hypothetical protein